MSSWVLYNLMISETIPRLRFYFPFPNLAMRLVNVNHCLICRQ